MRGHSCNGRGNGRGGRQDPIDDAFGYTCVRDPDGLSCLVDLTLYLTLSIQITKSTISKFSTVSELLAYRLPNSDSTRRIE